MILATALSDIRRDEGWREKVYDDSNGLPIIKGSLVAGNPTTGYGCRADLPMPRDVGELWMRLRLEGLWAGLLDRFPWLESQPDDVRRALQNMVYAMGVEGVARFGLMLAALQRGDRETAALNCLDSAWGKEATERVARVATLLRGHEPEAED